MKCITLTLNPAFDRHCFVKELKLGYEQLAEKDFSDAGGKGVNISRALFVNGIYNNAVIVVGDENKDAYCKGVGNLSCTAIETKGRIRENLTIHSADGRETRVSFKGFSANDFLLDKVYDVIEKEISGDTIFTFTGSVPSGISANAVNTFLEKIKAKGCRIVIDSKFFKTLEEIAELKPWLIKPNQEEISEYLGREVKSHKGILDVAQKLYNQGIENVMISLGDKGAMLVCKDGTYVCTPPLINVRSTIGAGDSSVAGFISAVIKGESKENALKMSVAYGTASCLREGTLPPKPDDICNILEKLNITEV